MSIRPGIGCARGSLSSEDDGSKLLGMLRPVMQTLTRTMTYLGHVAPYFAARSSKSLRTPTFQSTANRHADLHKWKSITGVQTGAAGRSEHTRSLIDTDVPQIRLGSDGKTRFGSHGADGRRWVPRPQNVPASSRIRTVRWSGKGGEPTQSNCSIACFNVASHGGTC
jgi:hypothetical protein